jgi:hypothetical protein
VYSYAKGLPERHDLWTYLEESQNSFLEKVRRDYLTSATGKLLLTDGQLDELADFALTRAEIKAFNPLENTGYQSPNRHGNGDNNDKRTIGSEEDLLPNNANPAGPDEVETTQPPQTATAQAPNPAAGAPGQPNPLPPPLGQTLAETQDAAAALKPTNEQKEALEENGTDAVRKVKDIMSDLISPLFFGLASTTEVDQRIQKANAKLEAAMKKQSTLDLGAAIAASLDNKPTVEHKNMQSLIDKVVNKKLDEQQRKGTKVAVKLAIKEARKKSLGGGGTTSPQLKQPRSGDKRKKQLNKVSFASGTVPYPKKPRKQQSQSPDSDYQQFLQWKKNPYWKPNGSSNPSSRGGRANSRGRGQGRGRSRGSFNNG